MPAPAHSVVSVLLHALLWSAIAQQTTGVQVILPSATASSLSHRFYLHTQDPVEVAFLSTSTGVWLYLQLHICS